MTVNGPIFRGSRCLRYVIGVGGTAREEARLDENPMRRLAHDQRSGDVAGQAVVVLVRVRDDDRTQRRIVVLQARHWRERDDLVALGPERATEIEDKAFALGLQLDAGAADFVRATMDGCLHRN